MIYNYIEVMIGEKNWGYNRELRKIKIDLLWINNKDYFFFI